MRYKMSQVFVKINIIKIFPILFFFSLLGAQWFEGNLYLPDSFSGTCGTDQMIWNSINDRIYLRGSNKTFVAIDGQSDEKVQPIRIEGNTRSHPGWFEWNQANNCLYIWCPPYRAFYDSLYIVDCQTHQTINVIPFSRNNFGLGNAAHICTSPVSNKVYLIKENNGAGSDYDTLLYIIDGNTHQVIKTIKFVAFSIYHDYYPSLKWNPINNRIYLLGYNPDNDSSGIAVIDCEIDSIISIIPLTYILVEKNWFDLDTLRNKLYLSINDTIGLAILEIDCFANNIAQRIDIPSNDDIEFVVNQVDRKIYYSYEDSRFVYFIDIPSGTITDSVFVGYRIGYLSLYKPNNELYCINGYIISVIDLSTNLVSHYELPDESDIEARPFLHPIRGKLYLSRGVGEAVVIFDCLTKTVRNVIFNGTYDVSDILLNLIEHKLYCSNGYRPYVFIFNSENLQAIRQLQVAPNGEQSDCIAFAPPHNKVYIYTSIDQIVVLDSQTDSIIKVIDGITSCWDIVYNSINDKLYTRGSRSYVIDCTTDSIIKVLDNTGSVSGDIKFDSLTNKVYLIGNKFVIIDCSQDSVIKRDTTFRGKNIHFRSHDDFRVYAGNAMFDRFTDSLVGYLPIECYYSEYNSILDYLYLSQYPSEENKIYVVDCCNHNVIDSILAGMPGFITGMFWNYLNNKLYFSPLDNDIWYEPVVVVDCQTNEIIATFPQIDRADLRFNSCLDFSNNRFYVNIRHGSRLGIIGDNIPGIEECNMLNTKNLTLEIYPNPAKSVMRVRCPLSIKEIKIFDVLGKLVKEEKAISAQEQKKEIKISLKGINPGIYFLRLDKETKKFIVTR